MKCPKCGIYYDDSDRECPMCGAPKPLFAKDKSNLAKETAYPASSDNKNTDSMGSILDLGSKKKTSWSKPKKDGRNTIIAVVIIILISVFLALITNIASNISNEPEFLNVQVEPVSDELSIETLKCYIIQGDETQFNIFDDGTYYVRSDDLDEWGQIGMLSGDINISDISEDFVTLVDNSGINLDDLDINIAILTEENSMEDKYIIIAESNTYDQVLFYDLNSDIPWIDNGVLVYGYGIE